MRTLSIGSNAILTTSRKQTNLWKMVSVPLLALCFSVSLVGTVAGSRNIASWPSAVNVGALFTFDSTIGRAAKLAIELAVEDVNSSPSVLAGTRLNLYAQDTYCSGFFGIIESM